MTGISAPTEIGISAKAIMIFGGMISALAQICATAGESDPGLATGRRAAERTSPATEQLEGVNFYSRREERTNSACS